MALPISYGGAVRPVRNVGGFAGYNYKAMTHNWDLIISALPSALSSVQANFGNQQGAINTSLTQVSGLPNSNIAEGVLSGNIRGIPFHQAGGRESSVREITLSMNEYYDYRLFRMFEAWKGLAVNRFDFSQNLDATIGQGVYIVYYDTDRQTPRATWCLYDVVCTQCQLAGSYGSDPDLGTVTAALKCGYYNIEIGSDFKTTDDKIDSDTAIQWGE